MSFYVLATSYHQPDNKIEMIYPIIRLAKIDDCCVVTVTDVCVECRGGGGRGEREPRDVTENQSGVALHFSYNCASRCIRS